MWRRILHRVVVYGLIGLVVNVFVAWGFAAWGRTSTAEGRVRVDMMGCKSDFVLDPSLTWSWRHQLLSEQPFMRVVSTGIGVRAIDEFDSRPVDWTKVPAYVTPIGEGVLLKRTLFGWPEYSLQWHEVKDSRDRKADVAMGRWIDLPGKGPVHNDSGFQRRLPLEPVWRGLALNTVVYAAVAVMVARMVRYGCGAARRRRGRCPSCAYDVRGDWASGCPECGWGRNT